MKLVIIEGAGKKETIEKYLGSGYKVFATKGHIRDLPVKTLAVNVKKNFEPKYDIVPDKKDIVKKMQAAAKSATEVLLATDPDREGEAISWHVATILDISKEKKARIVFNEISKKAVTAALENPRAIDLALVDAQQARRVLDRLVGYKVSPLLCRRIQNKLSAGRVQSVTLRLVVERDREILNFKPEEYWNFFSTLEKENMNFNAALHNKKGKKIKLSSAEEVENAKSELKDKPYIVQKVKRSVTQGRPSAPFITSSMQQDALNKLGFSLKQTTMTAQKLYEGVDLPGEGKVALVTYIRTDSTRVSPDAINQARSYIAQKYGEDYIPKKANIYSSKKGAQDAHEAIRPISVERTPDSLKGALAANLYKLYKLIYDRFLASQMSPAKYDSLRVDISAGEYGFKVSGKTMIFPGYTAIYHSFAQEKEGEEESVSGLPNLSEGDNLRFIDFKYEQKFTKPPAYYTEASLVKTMEEEGIGRPATYTPTVSLIQNREYVQKDGRALKATELGFKVNDMLVKYFPDIMDIKFTAEMESRLDKIEDGDTEWQQVVGEFYTGLEQDLKAAIADKEPDEESEYDCPECGTQLVYRKGRYGKFLACPTYPKCRFTQQIDKEGKPMEVKQEVSDVKCDMCGQNMVVKNGRYGKFLACPGYPKCKNIKSIQPTEEEKKLMPICPSCGNPLLEKRGRSVFYGCSTYPECKFTSSNKPVEGKCPQCDTYLVEKKYKDGIYHVCAKKGCKYKNKVSEAEATA